MQFPRCPNPGIGVHATASTFFCALGSLGLSGVAMGATITVGGAGAAAPTLSLGVSLASDGDTVLVDPGTYNEIIVTSKAIAIVADGAAGSVVVDGGSFSSVLSFVDAVGSVALDGLVVRNGQSARGAALRLQNIPGGVTLVDCRFEGNVASVSGGAIDAYDAVVEISGCEFENNVTSGPTEQRGGAISLRSGSSGSTIVETTFTHNQAQYGGAVWFSGNSTFGECVFVDNSAGRGGAVYSNDATNPTITHCAFRENSASEYGGSVYLSGTGGDIRWTTFEENNCTSCTGGAIYLGAGGDLDVHHCFFTENTADHGGAMGGASMLATVEHCTFYANSGAVEGSDIYFNQSGPDVTQNIFASPSVSASLHCEGSASPALGCNLFDSGIAGVSSGCDDPIGNDGNIESDPLFCSPGTGNFGLDGDGSPAAPGNGPAECPADGIGMYGVECGMSPVEPLSWGQLKSRFQ